jgi:hypothetical protein
VAAKGHPLWNFWPNLPTSLALVVSLGVTLISQARLAPDVKDASLNHVAAHVGVGGVMFLVVLGTLYLTVSAAGWVHHGDRPCKSHPPPLFQDRQFLATLRTLVVSRPKSKTS